jgi:hypothetical protein
MVSGKCGRQKRKNHAQDCGTLIRHQRPAILPWFSSLKWRPSFRWYGRFTRYRPAAGLLLDTLYFGHDLFPKTGFHFSESCPVHIR